ncbi:Uncharacterized protein Adt_41883 [Abeliophyllum distichum]|uniref:Uncharacterized protein n=1 Tax=Abeliophyllum distichum TaxID=126358 RepID=A0ABD1PQ53_9LAMI
MKKTAKNVGDLSKNNIMIQEFNQNGQQAIGMIRLKLQIGELYFSALFHVIDDKSSYKFLLGHVWLHETGVVPSTWNQYFKYSRDGEVKYVVAESKPFLKEESYFADAKFYSEELMVDATTRFEVLSFVDGSLGYNQIRMNPKDEELTRFRIPRAKKLRHYMLAYTINLVTKIDSLKYIMSRSILSGRIGKWALLLSEFDIKFIPPKAVKRQVLTYFLVDHPILVEWKLLEDFPAKKFFTLKLYLHRGYSWIVQLEDMVLKQELYLLLSMIKSCPIHLL